MLNILFLGLISFFTDISTEMVYPIIPLYLISSFGATPALVGIIEGIAESLASLLKVFSGYITDKSQNKKAIAFTGYTTGLLYKVALLLSTSWIGILLARVIDRIGKGIRTAPRDVLVSESAGIKNMGKAFGLHKALDMLGSALGILLTYFILRQFHNESNSNYYYKKLFVFSMIPAILGLLMFAFVKQKSKLNGLKTKELFWKNIQKVPRQLKLYLLVVFTFTLGNSSNTFILLKAKSAGFDDIQTILLYFFYNLVASALSFPLGKLSDKIGRQKLLIPGYAVFSLCYLGFAFAYSRYIMVSAFLLYGIYTAMIAGVERAFVAEVSPFELRGTMLGLHSTVAGIALFPASVIAGVLWNVFGDKAPFLLGAGLSLTAVLILVLFMRDSRADAQ